MDYCDQKYVREFQNEAKEQISKQFKIQSVLFQQKESNPIKLIDQIDSIILNKYSIQINISDQEFNHLIKNMDKDKQLMKISSEQEQQIKEFYDTCNKYLKQLSKSETFDDQILHSFQVFVRKYYQNSLTSIEQQFIQISNTNQQLDEAQIFFTYLNLKNLMNKMQQELMTSIDGMMNYSYDHTFRQLRKCPYCGTNWAKVFGCDDTLCGDYIENNNKVKFLEKQIFQEFQFSYNNKQITFKALQTDEEFNQDAKEMIEFQLFIEYLRIDVQQEQQLLSLKQQQEQQKEQQEEQQQQSQEQQKLLDRKYQIQEQYQQFQQKLKQQSQYEKVNSLRQVAGTSQFSKIHSFSRRKLVDQIQSIQLFQNGRIGCGQRFSWQNAPIVDLNDIDLSQNQINEAFSTNFQLNFQEQFNELKVEMIKYYKQHKKQLEPNNNSPYPKQWIPQVINMIKVELSQNDEEYKKVSQLFNNSYKKGKIYQINRIQNKILYKNFIYEKEKLINFRKSQGQELNQIELEKYVWHGVKSQHPQVIYQGQKEAFDATYCQDYCNMGPGIYFAENSIYSKQYSYTLRVQDSPQYQGKLVFLLCLIATGKVIKLNSDNKIKRPPDGYDCVQAYTKESEIYVLYQMDVRRAYPAYEVIYE